MNKKNKNKKKSKYKIFLYVILFILLVFLFFLLKSKLDLSKKNKIYRTELIDECSFIMGNIINKISNDDMCKLSCKTECDFLGKIYLNHSFILKKDSCNSCFCSCLG